MPKDNLIFKLDNLEYQYNYLNGTLDQFEPRLNGTKKLYNSIGKNNAKKVAKLLKELKKDEVEKNLTDLRLKIFNNKVYNCEKNMKAALLKQLKLEETKPDTKSSKSKNQKNKKKDLTPILSMVKDSYGYEEFVNYLIKSKLIKLSVNKIIPNKSFLDSENHQWFLNHEFWIISEDKSNKHNPSYVWNEIIMKTKGLDQLVSTLMNNSKVKESLVLFSNGMDVFLSINKGNKQSINNQKDNKSKKEQAKNKTNADNDSSDSESSEGSGEDEDVFYSFVDNNSNDDDNDEENNDDVDFDKIDDVLSQYKNAIGASDEEDPSDGGFSLNPTIDYNQVTDEEPSEEDDDIELNPRKKQKMELPELTTGFYSGDSDSDFEEDEIARDQKKNEAPKKNRRGQRARRKIWEKKYGSQAKHVLRDLEQKIEERAKRQAEYEARVAKRELKAQEDSASGANLVAVGERKAAGQEKPSVPKEEHPSWIAKKQQEEKFKKATFSGKKITFD
ncbi:hypothetical protein TPHA_0N01330 [Tetrapisispora phaffii CBS 4417]|uniref:Bud22 domain-containing protein n=1 Tax=Tetrapisispora phaffii (strain ATCC 24235 / CBS 4417 / NBRC 1672 / NRRL Y-8282 / UCD 70-5) TaxID=1071381 RepID=G8C186_TETPH|nr:hypothetical protein TPHA_0N01330 [Tetrapisispora phaffii CBS 4417]CCE65914.1 hypothetical protein TPHA_0N01330 [Tetrapisispora phaffii CBS 4417]